MIGKNVPVARAVREEEFFHMPLPFLRSPASAGLLARLPGRTIHYSNRNRTKNGRIGGEDFP
jgi:hypothetical protein